MHNPRGGRPRVLPLPQFAGNAWDWQHDLGESAHHFEIFEAYLALGPARTLQKVADAAGLRLTTVQELSSRYVWGPRVSASDALVEVETAGELAAGITAMRHRHANTAAELFDALGPVLLEQAKSPDLSPKDARQLAELAFKVERLSRGLSDRLDVRAEVHLSGHVSVDGLARVVVDALAPYPQAREAVETALAALDRQPAGQHRQIQGSVIR